jgi:hypothetical protein
VALTACIAILGCSACQGSAGASRSDEAPSLDPEFQAHLTECTDRTGYDPFKLNSLKAHELGANEPAYLSCAYDGVRRILMPKSKYPDSYERIIQGHKGFTEQVASGELTRTERRLRTDALIKKLQEKDLGTSKAPKADGAHVTDAMEQQLMSNVAQSIRMF